MKNIVLSIIIAFSLILTSCGNVNNNAAPTTSNNSIANTTSEEISEDTSEDDFNNTVKRLVSSNAKIDEDFAAWLCNTYTDEATLFSANDKVNLKSDAWRDTFAKSYYVLRDEYKGVISDKEKAFDNGILILDSENADDLTLAFAGDICFEDGGSPGYNYERSVNHGDGPFGRDEVKKP